MATVVEGQAAEKTQSIFIRFTCLDVTIKRGDATVIHYITGKIFSSSDGMIADFRDEPSDVCHKINHPFGVWPLLANPLQEIDVVDFLNSAL